MKRFGFLQGVFVAAVLAFVSSALLATLTPFLGIGSAVRMVIPAISLAYILYLLRASDERTGTVAIVSLWSALAIVTWWISPALPLYVLIHVGAIWLVRSLYFHSGVIAPFMDLGLSAIAVSAFVWALTHTGSVLLAAWSFFLVQALFVGIFRFTPGQPPHVASTGNEGFDRARRQADDALRLLLNQ
jgi:hypothetical protein